MPNADDLKNRLRRIDGKGFKAYRDIEGQYDLEEYTLSIERAQRDPFAPPTRVRAMIGARTAGFPADTYQNRSREIALRDFLTRAFSAAARRFSKGNRGTGNSGVVSIDQPGQEILERTSIFINEEGLEARFTMGLPAAGRSIASRHAEAMFFEELPKIISASLFYRNLKEKQLYQFIKTSEDTDSLREQLGKLGLIAFIADGAILPRASGVDPRPLDREKAMPFQSPESLRVEVELPNRGTVTGMGIAKGITLIVGGGYHGKSTLLKAIELGIYNHIPGDGRELVASNPQAIKIRAEDARRIEKVDISPFITDLPFGQDTRAFSTDDASGSTSQAANIIEALESGARVLLIDEDTSATNFMIRDHRMQQLVSKEKEPITPFIDNIRQLYEDFGASTILVLGGSGDYFDVADRVICMTDYQPHDLTEQAHEIAKKYRLERSAEGGSGFGKITERIPLKSSFDPSKGKREVKISSKGLQSIDFGTHRIDLGAVEQLVNTSQTNAIGDAIHYATRYMDGNRTIGEIVNVVLEDISKNGLDILNSTPQGNYASFRGLELAAAINRLRTLSIRKKGA
ncbi:MAG: ABC-ATPase domain-containing protein [Dehalococcoidia bacterium]